MFIALFVVIESDGTVSRTCERPDEVDGRFVRSIPVDWADFSVVECRRRIEAGNRSGAEALLDLYSKPL